MKTALWYPYTDMATAPPALKVAYARGCKLYLENGSVLIDAISSWWCVIHGYNHPELNRALYAQSEKVSHLMLGGLTHQPAEDLASRLVAITPEGLNHVFFSDSGSVAVEVALKIALQYWRNCGKPQKKQFISLKRAYHGDTFGAMSVSDSEEGMHHLYSPFFNAYSIHNPAQNNLQESLNQLETCLDSNGHSIAALILEPLLQAAGGLNIYSEHYLSEAQKICQKYNVLLIADEVATGFGRTGALFACNHAGVSPDILIVGKALTGGYLGLAATLTTSDIFESFYGNPPLMHGPTFMGNPLACSVALKSIQLFEEGDYLNKIAAIENQLKVGLGTLYSEKIKETRVLGATGVIEVKDASALIGLQDFAIEKGVWLRPFNQVVYTMPAYTIKEEELHIIIETFSQWFS